MLWSAVPTSFATLSSGDGMMPKTITAAAMTRATARTSGCARPSASRDHPPTRARRLTGRPAARGRGPPARAPVGRAHGHLDRTEPHRGDDLQVVAKRDDRSNDDEDRQ